MSKQPVAILDIDGVVYPFVTPLSVVASKHTGRPLEHFPEALVWDFFKDQWGLSTPEFLELMAIGAREHGLFGGATDPYPKAVPGIKLLQELGVHVHFATDCGDAQDSTGARANRLAWLARPDIDLAEIDITFTADKAAVALSYIEQGHRVYAADDRPENYEALAAVGAIAFLQDQKYNEFLIDAQRIHDLVEFAELIKSDLQALA